MRPLGDGFIKLVKMLIAPIVDQPEVRLDAGRVAVHHEADGAGRREDRRLGVAVAVLLTELDDVVPRLRCELGGRLSPSRRCVLMLSLAAWCLRMTRLWASALRA